MLTPLIKATVPISDTETLLESSDRLLERIHGEVVEKMPSALHGYSISLLSALLFNFLRDHPLGYVLVETRFRANENDLIPDIAFITQGREKLPSRQAVPIFLI